MTTTASRILAIDGAHTNVGFSVRHLMIAKVRGTFGTVSGTIALPDAGLIPTSVTAEIDVTSIDTREAHRDGHLKSPDFFHAEQYPTMRFASTSIAAKGPSAFELTGDLEIHGVTKRVTFAADVNGEGSNPFAPGDKRVAYEAKATIKRSDFGLTWNAALETGGVAVSDEVEITLDIQAIG